MLLPIVSDNTFNVFDDALSTHLQLIGLCLAEMVGCGWVMVANEKSGSLSGQPRKDVIGQSGKKISGTGNSSRGGRV